jgi:steroid 5-alpha reductase family enzyme
MPTSLTLLLIIWGYSIVALTILWFVQKRTGDAGIADFGWATCLVIAAIVLAVFSNGAEERRILVGVMGGLWAFRLAWYILTDRVMKGDEDGRYQAMREYWGDAADKNFFFFFQAQALFVLLFAIPLAVATANDSPALQWFDWLGLAIWVISIGGEMIADKQLARFRANPDNKGKTCREGLWRYSRHPNYFFEWVHWFAYLAISVGFSYWWMALWGPVVMFVFLFKVTGIPYTEMQAVKSRGDDYREYQRTTSMFFPWPPKESTA